VFAFVPDYDRERLLAAAKVALSVIQPSTVRGARAMLQYIVPIDADYDKARQSSAEALFGQAAPSLAVRDWALLLDAELEGVGESHHEFGIVRKAEIPLRLNRWMGRVSSEGEGEGGHDWPVESFPQVAFFLDGVWTRSGIVPGSGALGYMEETWERAVADGDRLVDELAASLGVLSERENDS
jgi:hypothetical protein